MKILIIEDEEKAAVHLSDMLSGILDAPHIEAVIDNVQDAKEFLSSGPVLDLIFLDISLSDGLSFEIFSDLRVDIPVIFTTAYDQYAIKAFELNSIDYLLKPIRRERLVQAVDKFRRLEQGTLKPHELSSMEWIKSLLKEGNSYKESFLVPYKDRLIPLHIDDIAWFELKNGLVSGIKTDNTSYLMEEKSLEELERSLNPRDFYRANRQYLVSRKAIKEVQYYFNGRLFLNVKPEPEEQVIISKVKAGPFKDWMRQRLS